MMMEPMAEYKCSQCGHLFDSKGYSLCPLCGGDCDVEETAMESICKDADMEEIGRRHRDFFRKVYG